MIEARSLIVRSKWGTGAASIELEHPFFWPGGDAQFTVEMNSNLAAFGELSLALHKLRSDRSITEWPLGESGGPVEGYTSVVMGDIAAALSDLAQLPNGWDYNCATFIATLPRGYYALASMDDTALWPDNSCIVSVSQIDCGSNIDLPKLYDEIIL